VLLDLAGQAGQLICQRDAVADGAVAVATAARALARTATGPPGGELTVPSPEILSLGIITVPAPVTALGRTTSLRTSGITWRSQSAARLASAHVTGLAEIADRRASKSGDAAHSRMVAMPGSFKPATHSWLVGDFIRLHARLDLGRCFLDAAELAALRLLCPAGIAAGVWVTIWVTIVLHDAERQTSMLGAATGAGAP
jgi:hypothetical protein